MAGSWSCLCGSGTDERGEGVISDRELRGPYSDWLLGLGRGAGKTYEGLMRIGP